MSTRLAALASSATLVLGAVATHPAAASSYAAGAGNTVGARAISPAIWSVDQGVRRFYTVTFDRPICHGSVDATIYSRSGEQVDWFFGVVNSCRSSYTFDENQYPWMAPGRLGIGTVKIVVEDHDAGDWGTTSTRTFPFAIKTSTTQRLAAARSGKTVTLTGTTMAYTLTPSYDPHWVQLGGVPVQFQRLDGKVWKTVATVKATTKGISSVRLVAAAKATYRALYVTPSSVVNSSVSAAVVK